MAAHAALRRALRDFAAPTATPARVPLAALQPVTAPVEEAAPPPDTGTLIAEAVRAAEAALAARLAADHAVALAALRAAHERETSERFAAFGAEALVRIEVAAAALGATLSGEISDQVARLLAPLLDQAQAHRAADELRAAITEALGGTTDMALLVRAPAALRETLEPRLRDAGFSLRWEETPGFDIEASAGAALWRTRLGEWRAGLDAALAGDVA